MSTTSNGVWSRGLQKHIAEISRGPERWGCIPNRQMLSQRQENYLMMLHLVQPPTVQWELALSLRRWSLVYIKKNCSPLHGSSSKHEMRPEPGFSWYHSGNHLSETMKLWYSSCFNKQHWTLGHKTIASWPWHWTKEARLRDSTPMKSTNLV